MARIQRIVKPGPFISPFTPTPEIRRALEAVNEDLDLVIRIKHETARTIPAGKSPVARIEPVSRSDEPDETDGMTTFQLVVWAFKEYVKEKF